LIFRNFIPLPPGFIDADGYCLIAAGYLPVALAASQLTFLKLVHRLLNGFSCFRAIFVLCHHSLLFIILLTFNL
jgi:hypothetical protein